MSRLLRARTLTITALTLLAFACGGGADGPTPPSELIDPARMEIAAGAALQQGTVGTTVAIAPTVRLVTKEGQPVGGVAVTFAVVAGGGRLGAVSVRTEDDGIASAGSWTLGTTAGQQKVTVTAGSLSAQLTAVADPGPVAHLQLVAGVEQSGGTGGELPSPVVARAADSYDNPVPDVLLSFDASADGGSVVPAQARSSAIGEARTVWTLGPAEGSQRLDVRVVGRSSIAASTTATAELTLLMASRVDVGGESVRCVLRREGVVYCWGRSPWGQLGDGTTEERTVPVRLKIADVKVTQLSLGTRHGCLLTESGAASCWGQNGGSQLGDGTLETRLTPVEVAGGHVFTSIAAGRTTTCALDTDALAWCWGIEGGGALNPARSVPALVTPDIRFTSIAVGTDYNCAVSADGPTYCWGTRIQTVEPTQVAGGLAFTSLTVGFGHACALLADGDAYCWGSNDSGQLGDGSTWYSTTPMPVIGAQRFVALDAGALHTCGITVTGEAYCWGSDASAQLGDGRTAFGPTSLPVRANVPADVRFRSIAAGEVGTCAIATTAHVYCWGVRRVDEQFQFVLDLVPTLVRGQ